MDGDARTTTDRLGLFGSKDSKASWNYLFIDAKNIANVLFDPSPEIKTTERGNEALDRALAELRGTVEHTATASASGKLAARLVAAALFPS
jgi:isochorismate synthase EntC